VTPRSSMSERPPVAARRGRSRSSTPARSFIREHHLKTASSEVGCHRPLLPRALHGHPDARPSADQLRKCRRRAAKEIIESCLPENDRCLHLAAGHFGKTRRADERASPVFRSPHAETAVRVVLRNCGIIDPEDIDHYLANGGTWAS